MALAGLFGALVGSFLNVVIHRLPARRSLVTPVSYTHLTLPTTPYV